MLRFFSYRTKTQIFLLVGLFNLNIYLNKLTPVHPKNLIFSVFTRSVRTNAPNCSDRNLKYAYFLSTSLNATSRYSQQLF